MHFTFIFQPSWVIIWHWSIKGFLIKGEWRWESDTTQCTQCFMATLTDCVWFPGSIREPYFRANLAWCSGQKKNRSIPPTAAFSFGRLVSKNNATTKIFKCTVQPLCSRAGEKMQPESWNHFMKNEVILLWEDGISAVYRDGHGKFPQNKCSFQT